MGVNPYNRTRDDFFGSFNEFVSGIYTGENRQLNLERLVEGFVDKIIEDSNGSLAELKTKLESIGLIIPGLDNVGSDRLKEVVLACINELRAMDREAGRVNRLEFYIRMSLDEILTDEVIEFEEGRRRRYYSPRAKLTGHMRRGLYWQAITRRYRRLVINMVENVTDRVLSMELPAPALTEQDMAVAEARAESELRTIEVNIDQALSNVTSETKPRDGIGAGITRAATDLKNSVLDITDGMGLTSGLVTRAHGGATGGVEASNIPVVSAANEGDVVHWRSQG